MVVIGFMRELSMRYNIKNILGTSALALVLSLSFSSLGWTQGVIKLDDKSKSQNAEEFTDEISLFGDDNKNAVITPAKSSSGVKSAAELGLGGKVQPKSAAELGLGGKVQPKSAADLGLGGKVQPKSAAELGLGGKVQPKSAADLGLGGKVQPKSAAELSLGGKAQPTNTSAKQDASSSEKAQPIKMAEPQLQLVKDVDDKIFDQMSELEKQTAILNLELKKEKVQSSIESLKAMRNKAQQEENARKEEEKRKQQEWENEQERKLLQEQQKLKELEISLENARQEKILKAYKNKMLQQMQDFIASKEETYKEISTLRNEKAKLINDFKGRFVQLKQLADQATSDAIKVRDEHAKTVSDLQTQISILNARLEAAMAQQNPFAEGEAQPAAEEENAVKLSDMYAIMEIRGQGDNTSAKLINASGQPFWVKIGTKLQSGHTIDEISQTYVRTDKNGAKEYLYFSAGGILDKEPVQTTQLNLDNSTIVEEEQVQRPSSAVFSRSGIPNMSAEMVVR